MHICTSTAHIDMYIRMYRVHVCMCISSAYIYIYVFIFIHETENKWEESTSVILLCLSVLQLVTKPFLRTAGLRTSFHGSGGSRGAWPSHMHGLCLCACVCESVCLHVRACMYPCMIMLNMYACLYRCTQYIQTDRQADGQTRTFFVYDICLRF